MRTLFVTVDSAYPPVSGADLRSWQNARAASALGEVTLASLAAASHPAPAAPANLRLAALSTPADGDIYPWPPVPEPLVVRISPAAISRFEALLRDWAPETVVFESLPLHALMPLARHAGARTVLDLHNVESELLGTIARAELPFGLRRWWRERAVELGIAAIERKAVALADRVWVCSREDARRLARVTRHAASRTVVVPNGIPRAEAIPSALPPPRARAGGEFVLLFAGHLDYAPNRAAASWLATRILPALRPVLPGARLVLAGRSPAPDLRALAMPGAVDIAADPERMDAILGAADAAVLPLRAGGGTRIKALEAMAWGVPIVATKFAVEGLGLAPGTHYRRAETTRGFAAAIAALAGDSGAYAAQRAAAREHALARFGPAAIVDAVRRALGDGPSPGGTDGR